jgi:mannose-6-phosphate isomerase-like protein (cupin superfamily)
MTALELDHLIAKHEACGGRYLEFLRVPALSMGLYVLPAGGTDPQRPHSEDELYYVVSGRGRIQVGDEDRAVAAGTLLLVPAGVEHRFHEILEQLTILVFFAPAEKGTSA